MRAGWLVLVVALGCRSKAEAPARPPTGDRAQAAFDRYRRPDLVVQALDLHPGEQVADVGAGQGYLTYRLAAKVAPTGRVVATDIDPRALEVLRLAGESQQESIRSLVHSRLVQPETPGLESHQYDLLVLSEVDHLLADRSSYLAELAHALKPGGRIAVINRKTYRTQLLHAAEQAGLSFLREPTQLPAHFLFLFEVKR